MKNLFLILSLSILSSCATTEYSETQVEKLKTQMTSLNSHLSGDFYLKYLNKDLTSLNKEIYLKYAIVDQDPSEKQYVALLTNKNIEIVLKSEVRDFVVCVKDRSPLLVLCDRANKDGIELVAREDLALIKIIEEI